VFSVAITVFSQLLGGLRRSVCAKPGTARS
jgi:hypothetical protein